jgi:hypothetical protein
MGFSIVLLNCQIATVISGLQDELVSLQYASWIDGWGGSERYGKRTIHHLGVQDHLKARCVDRTFEYAFIGT